MSKTFTSKSVEQFKPHKTRREIHDGGCKGLYLYIQPSGTKSWVLLLARPNGKMGKLHLGSLDLSGKTPKETPKVGTPLTLAGARALAADLYRQREAGKDVIADRKAQKEQQRHKIEERDDSYATVARQFIDEYARPKTRRWLETARLLGLDYSDSEPKAIKGGLAERWRKRPIAEISSHDIYCIVDEAKRHGTPGLERRSDKIKDSRGRAIARTLSKLFGWTLQHRRVTANPCTGVYVPPAPKARDRVLTDDEIIRFWRATDKISNPFGPAVKLLLLTGARLREVSDMRRVELSQDGKTWTIPGTRTKNGRSLIVPLPPMARDILAAVKQIAGKPGFVFSTTGGTPISGFSKTKRRIDQLMLTTSARDGVEIAPWRLHDLRRTAATGMANLGIAPHVIEAALNHVSGAKASVAGTYNRAAYEPEKRVALERWAAHVEALVKRPTDQHRAALP
jgi:integrase